VTHDLTETLVEMAHDVTLFAAADSITQARLHVTAEAPLSSLTGADDRAVEDRHIVSAMAAAAELGLDIVHSHLHVHALAHAGLAGCPVVTTLHGVAWSSDTHDALRRHAEMPFVSLSDSERSFLPELNYVATVPNGIRTEDFPYGDGEGGYLAFVGRISPEKAPDLAVEAAQRAGLPLLMAGLIEDKYQDYADAVFARAGREVDFLGPLDRPDLSLLLREASATIMPLQWDEPFGLVVVESLSAGTPVVAWRRGAMPEIVDDEVTGFLVDDVSSAVDAINRVDAISRTECARVARERFDRTVMAAGYGRVYESVAAIASRR
jgi:glycosyltransferase involved in cell wall biosynthesis